MSLFYYDLHIHSCLSPCGDDDMTPQNIVGMAALKGLQILALTDHNTVKNCPTFMEVAKEYGICAIPGMELTTAEEIHMLCLFPTMEAASSFEEVLEEKRMKIPNKPDIFGHQYMVNKDETLEEPYSYLLSVATFITVDEAIPLVEELGGFICPAHVDRPSNGMIGVLGTVPLEYGFSHIEYNRPELADKIRAEHGLAQTASIFNSDAHRLWEIAEPCHQLEVNADTPTACDVIRCFKNARNFTTHS